MSEEIKSQDTRGVVESRAVVNCGRSGYSFAFLGDNMSLRRCVSGWVARFAAVMVVFVTSAQITGASAQATSASPTPLPPVPGLLTPIAGEWSGQYTCGGGVTGLRLALSKDGSRALFYFFPLPQNPNIPEGCFTMSGYFQPIANSLNLKATKWILRPKNFVTVDMNGTLDTSGQNFSGRIFGPSCTQFSLTHRAIDRPMPNLCESVRP